MNTRVCLLYVAMLLALGGAGRASAESAADSQRGLTRVATLIDSLQLDEAEKLLAQLNAAKPDTPAVIWELGMLAFYRGDYPTAVAQAQQAIALAGGEDHVSKHWTTLQALFISTDALTRDYVKITSDDGRYVISFPEGKERLLAPYALDVLTAMDRALTAIMGVPVPGPIRLEIYPSEQSLAEVSSLTVENIETSGTVALCKWNRLMITSPRALVRGYPWADTIAHELTHLYISYTTKERAPVWLQEGTAKLLERRWRNDKQPFTLDPTARGLLSRATRNNKLLTFEQLHPSIALLPSQDDAALAFAQVSTFMSEFIDKHGESALRGGFGLISDGKDARDALSRAAGTTFAELEKAWKATLPRSGDDSAPRKLARRFRKSHGDTPDETADVATTDARRFLRIGDLLWNVHRVRAAMLEYDKAHQADTDDPIVAARLARAALEAGDAARSLAAVDALVVRYPEHAPTHAVRGAALAALDRKAEARSEVIEAIRINPFDPDPHCVLARVTSDEREAKTERDACAQLSGR